MRHARQINLTPRLLFSFNRPQDQFSNDEEWFDYQELIEDHSKLLLRQIQGGTLHVYLVLKLAQRAVFSLVEGQNVQQTESAIEAYRKANYDSIVANDAKKVSPSLICPIRAAVAPSAVLYVTCTCSAAVCDQK